MNFIRIIWTILRCAFMHPNTPIVIDYDTGRVLPDFAAGSVIGSQKDQYTR